MISMPNLPTDSFYKYLTVLGTGMIFVPLGLTEFVKVRRDEEIRLVENERDQKYDAKLDLLLRHAPTLYPTLSEQERQQKVNEHANVISNVVNLQYWERISKIKESSKCRRDTLFYVRCFGTVLLWAGVYFWFVRGQTYQDRLLRAESAKATGLPAAPTRIMGFAAGRVSCPSGDSENSRGTSPSHSLSY